MTSILTNIVILFGAALVVATVLRIIRVPTVIGFLLAGVALGPSGVNLIRHDSVGTLAEIGIVLLLFTVGLELSPESLARGGRRLLVAGGVQGGGTIVAAAAVLHLAFGMGLGPALLIGVIVALSSTAIVLKQLTDSGETDTSHGSITTGVLLLQDMGVIALMVLLPLVGGTAGGSGWAMAGGLAVRVAAMGAVVVGGRTALPWVLDQVLRRGGREMMTLFAVVAACAGAWAAEAMHWSGALGACIAGMLLAGTDVRHQLCAEIVPFRDVFNALFFMSVGMTVDLANVGPHLPMIGVAVAVTLVAKTALTAGAVGIAGWPLRVGVHVGINLCTVSEFGYVLARLADGMGLLPAGAMAWITAYTVGTMLVGAMLLPVGDRFATGLAALVSGKKAVDSDGGADSPHAALENHVVIVGYGLNGQNLARVLRATRIPFCVIEMNRTLAARSRREGDVVLVGDAARQAMLHHAGIERARALVVVISDQAATRRIVAQAHAAKPGLYVLARTRYVSELEPLYRLGARQVIPEEFETSIEIFAHVLKELAIPDNVIDAQVQMVRAGRYGMLRGLGVGPAAQTELRGLLEVTATQTYLLTPDSPAVGRTLGMLNLRATTGVSVIAAVRSGTPTVNPGADHALASGDVLVLLGGHKELEAAKAVLAGEKMANSN